MLKPRKNFIPVNESFICDNCQKKVPKATGTFRNHCPFCLYSKHVDKEVPGDRRSNCGGLMKPIKVEKDAKREWMIVQQCLKCRKINRNRVAGDDDQKSFTIVSKQWSKEIKGES